LFARSSGCSLNVVLRPKHTAYHKWCYWIQTKLAASTALDVAIPAGTRQGISIANHSAYDLDNISTVHHVVVRTSIDTKTATDARQGKKAGRQLRLYIFFFVGNCPCAHRDEKRKSKAGNKMARRAVHREKQNDKRMLSLPSFLPMQDQYESSGTVDFRVQRLLVGGCQ
jgi:hypothetical protein